MDYTVETILREPEVRRRTSLARSTRWALERDGLFPKRVKLTCRAVGWKESEVAAWIEARDRVGDTDRESV